MDEADRVVFVMADSGDRKEGSSNRGGKGAKDRRLEQAAHVAQVLLDRDDHVARGLALLGGLGVLDERTQERLWSLYQQGDQATRRFLQEQIVRVVGEDPARSEQGDQAGKTDSSVDPLELEVLKQLSSPHVDAAEVAQHVRRFDPARLLGASKDPGGFMRFLSDAPLAVHRVQKRLMWAGASILVFVVALVATAVFVPAIVPWVGLGGVVLLALFFGVLLVRTASWIGRAAKGQGIDLGVYAQLPEDERRVLLVRRIGLRILDPQKSQTGPFSDRDRQAVAQPADRSAPEPPPGPVREPVRGPDRGGPEGDPAKEEPVQEQEVLKPREPVPPALVSSSPASEDSSEKTSEDAGPEGETPMTLGGRNGRNEAGSGRFARWVQGARKSWRQAAGSETAHKVGSETQRVSQAAGRRAKEAGHSAKKRVSQLREKGEGELAKRRQGGPKKAPLKKRSAKKTARKNSRKSSKKAPKKASKKNTKSSQKQAGKKSSQTARPPPARQGPAKKGPAKKGPAKKGPAKKGPAKKPASRQAKKRGGDTRKRG